MKKPAAAKALLFACIVLTIILLIGFASLAFSGFVSDSEIWAITNGKHLAEDWAKSWIITRPLFYLALAAASLPFHTATSIFYSAKIVGLVNGILIAIFTFLLARRLADKKVISSNLIPWIAVMLLFSNPGFMNQGYRIRSDPFSTWLTLFALERTLSTSATFELRYALYWALPFLATPKAILHVLPALVMLRSRRQKSILLSTLLACVLIITLIYPEAISVFIDTYLSSEARQSFLSSGRFIYLERLLTYGAPLFFLGAIRTITLLIRLHFHAFSDGEKEKHVQFAIFTLATVAVATLSPEKVPFFLASFLPILGVFAALLLEDLLVIIRFAVTQSRIKQYENLSLFTALTLLTALTMNAGLHWKSFKENNNASLELDIVRQVESYLNKYPLATYYDVVGLVPQRASIRVFSGPNDEEMNKNSAIMLAATYKPDLIFTVFRARYLVGLQELLKKEYHSIGPNAFARWTRLPTPTALPLKAGQAEALVKQMKSASGAKDLAEFYALIRPKNAPAKERLITRDKLLRIGSFSRGATLVAVSPFLPISDVTALLPSIIRFDWDWTGASPWDSQDEEIEE